MGRSRPSTVLVALLVFGTLTAGCGGSRTEPPQAAAAVPAPAQLRTAPVNAPLAAPERSTRPTPTPDTGAVLPCTGPGLSMSLAAPQPTRDGLTQTMFFQNTGSAPCVVRGFPAVSFVAGNEGTPVGAQALPIGRRGDEVRLEPRGAAEATLQITRAASYDAELCQPVPVRGLRVAPPGGSGSVFVPREDTACSHPELDEPQMRVGTVAAR